MTKQALSSQTVSKATSSRHALKLRMAAEKGGEIRHYLLKFPAIFQEGEGDHEANKTQQSLVKCSEVIWQ